MISMTKHARILAVGLSAVMLFSIPTATFAQSTASSSEEQWEQQVGQQYYQQLQQQGKIVAQSPDYAILNPIGKRIASVADAEYFAPFRFILVRDTQPNAFSVPGGNVYVTTAMMSFAKSREELSGVLCHEVSHAIHHDVYNLQHKNQNLGLLAGIAGLLVGNSRIGQYVVGAGAELTSLSFSRPVESAADHKGAYICAQAGINPWGMVWLFNRFESQQAPNSIEALSDHPNDSHRINDLEAEFRGDPQTFGKYNANEALATPLR
jgi:predicted Zn-dependent protease